MTPAELPLRWREEAEVAEALGDSRGAVMCRRFADALAAALRNAEGELLTLEAAADASGYSSGRLRHMVADGLIPNAGAKGRPRIRRGDLPKKVRRTVSPFDMAAATARMLKAG